MIDQRAAVHPDAKLGNNVTVGPFSYIGPDVEIGDDTWIGPNVVIKGPTRIGKGNKIFQFSSIGEECQDKKYAGEPTELHIGDHNVIRECVTIHRGTVQDRGVTQIGSHCLLMAYVHVAHDCVVGDNAILANCATLAGHVKVGDWVIIGGMCAFHQFVQIGDHAFIAGGSAVHKDVPPYVMARGDNAHGINIEGLKRRGFERESILALRRAYKVLYRQGLTIEEARPQLEEIAGEAADVQPLLAFLDASTRGIIR